MKRLSHTVRGLRAPPCVCAGLWICQKNNRTARARAAMFINNCVLYSFAVLFFLLFLALLFYFFALHLFQLYFFEGKTGF